MGIVIKQSLRSSLIAYIGVIIGYVNVLWLYPYFLSTEQIGLFRLVQSSAYLLATFGQMGLPQSFIRFFPDFKKEKGFLPLFFLGGLVGFGLLLLIAFILQKPLVNYFSQESSLFIEFFQLTLFISLLIVLFQLMEAYSRSLLNIIMPTFLRDIGLRLGTSILLFGYGFQFLDFHGLMYGLLVVYGSVFFGLVFYYLVKNELPWSFNFSFLSLTNFKKIGTFGLFSLIGAGGTQIILQIDSIMISGALGLEQTGIYTIAFFIGTVIEIPKRAISQLAGPLISKSFSEQNHAAIQKLYRQTAINQLIIGSLLLLGIWANLDNIYSFIPNAGAYRGGMEVVLLIGLGKLSDMAFGANGEIIVMSKYYRFNVFSVALLAILTIVLNLILIPILGIKGAALASLCAMLVFNLTKFIFIRYKLSMQPFSHNTLVFLGLLGLTLVANHFLPNLGNRYTDILVRSTMISSILLGGTLALKLSEELNELVSNLWRKMRY